MKLHLPKVLLTAVLAVMVMPTAWAASTTTKNSGWGVIKDNYGNSAQDSYAIGDASIAEISTSDSNATAGDLFLRSNNGVETATVTTLNNAGRLLTIDGWWKSGDDTHPEFENLTIGTLNLSGGATIIVESSNTVTINKINGSLNSLTNKGTLTLNDAMTVTGTLTLNSGSSLTLNNAVNLKTNAITGSGAVTGTEGAVLTISSAEDHSYNGVISGAIALKKEGAGTMTLSGNNTFTGGTTVSGGTLKIGSNNTVAGTGGVLVQNGATLDLSGKEGLYQTIVTLAGGATLQNTASGLDATKRQMKGLTLTGAAEVNIANSMGIIAGNYDSTTLNLGGNTLTKKGDGTFYMVNTSGTEAGLIEVEAGGIQIGTSGSGSKDTDIRNVEFNLASGTSVSLVNGADLTIKAITGSGGVTGTANTVLTLTSAEDHSYSGVISGAIALKKEGSGTLTLSGNNTYTGGTTINGGTVIVNSDSTLGKGNVTINNATVEATHSSSGGTSVMGNANATVTINGGGTLKLIGHDMLGYNNNRLGNLKLAGTADALAQLIIDDTGSMTLQTNVTMEGNSRLSGDKLNTFGTSFTVTGGDNKIDIATFELRNDWNVTVDNQLIDGQVIEGILEISSTLTNSSEGKGKLIKKGSGTLLISGTGNNTFSQGVTIDGGVLKLGKSSALGSGAVTVNDGGTLDMNGKEDVENAVTLKEGATLTNTESEIVNGKKQLPNVTLEGDATVTGSKNFAMVASGHGQAYLNLNTHTLTKEGSNTFTLSNTAVSAGTLLVQEGTLQILRQNGNGTTNLNDVDVTVGQLSDSQRGTFKLNNVDVTVSNLAMEGGIVNLNDKSLSVSGITTATSGTITGSGSLNMLTSDGTVAALSVTRKDDDDIALTNVTLSNTGIGAVEGTQGSSIANALVELKQNSSFSITDVTMSNVEISAAEVSTPVLLQPVEATNVSLTKGTFMTEGDVAKTESGSTPYAYSTDALSGITLNNAEQSANIVLNLGGMSDFAQNAMGICDISITLTGFSVNAVNLKGIYFAADSWLGQLLAAQGADAYVKDSILSVAQVYNLTDSAADSTNVSVSFETSGDDTVITIEGLDMVPEPTTTTLSLLALTALAARRRRR